MAQAGGKDPAKLADALARAAEHHPAVIEPLAARAADAAGTTYDGATPRLRASTPISPGRHAVYLSIFDQGDAIYDSIVFLDRLVFVTVPASQCAAGSSVDTDNDGYPDSWNAGRDEDDSTTGLELDAFPTDAACWLAARATGVSNREALGIGRVTGSAL